MYYLFKISITKQNVKQIGEIRFMNIKLQI